MFLDGLGDLPEPIPQGPVGWIFPIMGISKDGIIYIRNHRLSGNFAARQILISNIITHNDKTTSKSAFFSRIQRPLRALEIIIDILRVHGAVESPFPAVLLDTVERMG
jgi:hypothetical protein